ncbi:PH domain protein [Thermoascus aurantiacus ATCC 26904]
MASPTSPVEPKLPQRTGTLASTVTNTTAGRTSFSDDEAIPVDDTSETTALLVERLQAWKHLCGYLEDYVEATAKVQKSHSKDYEKILKTISDPLREAHHFDQSPGGIATMYENLRQNTQGMMNMYLETEKNLKSDVLPILEQLHKEIKSKTKEVQSGAAKGAKAVDRARAATQKHIELLGQQTAAFDAAAGNKLEPSNDPYIIRRGINYRLNKQIIEENNARDEIIAVQNSFQQFEAHVIQTFQNAINQFFQLMGGQADRQRAMYADILGSFQKIPLDFEWNAFVKRNDAILVDPDEPPRSLSSITFPNMDHRATKPLMEGTLERKSRAILKGYSSGYYVVTPARYLHEFKDNDDFRKDPSPELTLYLPDCIIGAIDGVKFSIKGKDVSGGTIGNAFHTTTELSFKAPSPSLAEAWFTALKRASVGPVFENHGPSGGAQPPAQANGQSPTETATQGQTQGTTTTTGQSVEEKAA